MIINHNFKLADNTIISADICKKLKECGAIDPIVAGGYLRDWRVEPKKSPKDIDVFYNGDIDEEKLKKYFTVDDDDFGNPGAYDDGEFHVTHPCVFMEGMALPIQLIKVHKNPVNFVETEFGCEISKVWADDEFFGYTEGFYKDLVSKTLTFMPECQKSYVIKLLIKFPTYKSNLSFSNENLDWLEIFEESFSKPIKQEPKIRILNRPSTNQ